MGKLVVLKIGEGSFEQGFPIILQVVEEGSGAGRLMVQLSTEITGRLPPAPEVAQAYTRWQSSYRRLGMRSRLNAPTAQVTNVSVVGDCLEAAQELRDRLNLWLRSEPFRPIREKWLEKLLPSDPVRVILQTENPLLQRLPWHLLDILERYPKAEVALSAPMYDCLPRVVVPTEKVRILAILGNSQGIDTETDRALLEQLPDAEVRFLVEPQRKELTDQLWDQHWDILFFAGHSSSQKADGTGEFAINQTETLSISQFRYALRKALERGLKLAIFNSCDGLGLARSLADLQIPQIIVMREPVPDRVAQEFLKHFLTAFSGGAPFYLAVREGRERLQDLEEEFLCATWLPVICQNPAEVPPTWQSFIRQRPSSLNLPPVALPPQPSEGIPSAEREPQRRKRGWRSLGTLAATGLAITLGVMGIRTMGVLQPLELKLYDQMLKLRPGEKPDSRILVVTVNQQEKQTYGQQNYVLPDGQTVNLTLSDRSLNQLLGVLQQAQAQVIGLDLYRDFPVSAAESSLADRLRQDSRIVGVCKTRYLEGDSIAPPPDVPVDRVGFSDFVPDADGILRRHLMAMSLGLMDPGAACVSNYAFNYVIAAQYLKAQGVSLQISPKGEGVQFGEPTFLPLLLRPGGYQQVDARGIQFLLNYRTVRAPFKTPFTQVSISDLLSGAVVPDLIQGRIVLIGDGAVDSPDQWDTPIQSHLPGVVTQAHMISQIVSAALDRRPLIWMASVWVEGLWVALWALLGGAIALSLRPGLKLGLLVGLSAGVLYGICYLMLAVWAGWMPFVPAAIALVGTSGAIALIRCWRPASSTPELQQTERRQA